MVDPVVETGVADTLERRLADARRRHKAGEYGPTLPLEIVDLGIRTKWASDHPSRPVSPRLVSNEGSVNEKVNGGAQVGGSAGMKKRGAIKVDGGVDGSPAGVQRLTAVAGSLLVDVDGQRRSPQRSSGRPTSTAHVMAGGIVQAYGYFKFSPEIISVPPLQGRRDLITWRETIKPQMEIAGLMGFADGIVPRPEADDVELLAEFCAAQLLTFMVISRCCSPVVLIALKLCRQRLDTRH
ncbi:unnamed protein product [Closterium sp. NIES-54]